MDETKSRRRGPVPLGADKKRDHSVSVRMNPGELAWLDASRAAVQMRRGEYLRSAALGKLPPTIPELNREAWAALARVAGNLNQLAKAVNEGRAVGLDLQELRELRAAVQDCRRDLLGVKPTAEDEPE